MPDTRTISTVLDKAIPPRKPRQTRIGLGAAVVTLTMLGAAPGARAYPFVGGGATPTSTTQAQEPAHAPAATAPVEAPVTPGSPLPAAPPAVADPAIGFPPANVAAEIPPPAPLVTQTPATSGADVPVFEKWWFWTGVAAVAVTAVVILAASSGPRQPSTDLGNMIAF